jgi:hypothetical protein
MTSLGFVVTSSSKSQLMYELALLLSEPVDLILVHTSFSNFPYNNGNAYEMSIAWKRASETVVAMNALSMCSKECWRDQSQIAAAVKHAVVLYVEELVAIITRVVTKEERAEAELKKAGKQKVSLSDGTVYTCDYGSASNFTFISGPRDNEDCRIFQEEIFQDINKLLMKLKIDIRLCANLAKQAITQT